MDAMDDNMHQQHATRKASGEGCNAEDHAVVVANVVASSTSAAFATIVVALPTLL